MTDGQTDGGDCNIPNAFLKKSGDKYMAGSITWCTSYQDYSIAPWAKKWPKKGHMFFIGLCKYSETTNPSELLPILFKACP